MGHAPGNSGERISGKKFAQLKEQTTLYFIISINMARKLGIPIIVTSEASFRTGPGERATRAGPYSGRAWLKIGEGPTE
jgi:hypothetical protein